MWFVYIQMCKSTVAHTSPIGKLSTNMYNSTGQSIIIGFGIVSALLSYSLGVVSESNTTVAAILPSYENQAAMESSGGFSEERENSLKFHTKISRAMDFIQIDGVHL